MAGNSKGTTGAKKGSKGKGKIIVFAIEILLILIMLVLLFFVMTQGGEGPKKVEIDTDNIGINDKVREIGVQGGENTTVEPGEIVDTGYMNIALFGVDATTPNGLYKGSRSDCTMIASINMDTGDIKLVSVYRDTYLNLGTDKYDKCNK